MTTPTNPQDLECGRQGTRPAERGEREPGSWLPDMDLNHDKQIQSLLCYRYTIGQTNDFKVGVRTWESRYD